MENFFSHETISDEFNHYHESKLMTYFTTIFQASGDANLDELKPLHHMCFIVVSNVIVLIVAIGMKQTK